MKTDIYVCAHVEGNSLNIYQNTTLKTTADKTGHKFYVK
jgi:hypothetical protein